MPISNNTQSSKPALTEWMTREVTAMCRGEDVVRKNGDGWGVRDFISSRPKNTSKKNIHHQKERGSPFLGTVLDKNERGRAGSTGGGRKKRL